MNTLSQVRCCIVIISWTVHGLCCIHMNCVASFWSFVVFLVIRELYEPVVGTHSPKVPLLRNMVIVREFPYILNLWYECEAASDLLKAPLFFALSMFVCQGMINCKLTVPWNRPECLITMSGDWEDFSESSNNTFHVPLGSGHLCLKKHAFIT